MQQQQFNDSALNIKMAVIANINGLLAAISEEVKNAKANNNDNNLNYLNGLRYQLEAAYIGVLNATRYPSSLQQPWGPPNVMQPQQANAPQFQMHNMQQPFFTRDNFVGGLDQYIETIKANAGGNVDLSVLELNLSAVVKAKLLYNYLFSIEQIKKLSQESALKKYNFVKSEIVVIDLAIAEYEQAKA